MAQDSIGNDIALTTGRTIVALFTRRSQARAAIEDLRQDGFSVDQIGIAMQDRDESPEPVESSVDEKTERTTVGALTGGVLGSLVGLLTSLLIPGIGPILVGGVLASLVGAGVGVATGGMVGALAGIGVHEDDASRFEAGLRAGGTLVTVSAGNRTADALAILLRHEADLGSTRGERRSSRDEHYTGPERRLARI